MAEPGFRLEKKGGTARLGPHGHLPELTVRWPVEKSGWFLFSLHPVIEKLYTGQVSHVKKKRSSNWTEFYQSIFDDAGPIPLIGAASESLSDGKSWRHSTVQGLEIDDDEHETVRFVQKLSTNARGLLAILGHAVYRPRGENAQRLLSAKVLRDLVNVVAVNYPYLIFTWGELEWTVAISHDLLEFADVDFPDKEYVYRVWNQYVLKDSPEDSIISSDIRRPRVGELVSFLLYWKWPTDKLKESAIRSSQNLLGQIANILQCKVPRLVTAFKGVDSFKSRESSAILQAINEVYLEKRAASLAHYFRMHSYVNTESRRVGRIMIDDNLLYQQELNRIASQPELHYYGLAMDAGNIKPNKVEVYHCYLPEESEAVLPPPLVHSHAGLTKSPTMSMQEKVSLKALAIGVGRTGQAQKENNKLAKARKKDYAAYEQIKSLDKTWENITGGSTKLYDKFLGTTETLESLAGKPLQNIVETHFENLADDVRATMTERIKEATEKAKTDIAEPDGAPLKYVPGRLLKGKQRQRVKRDKKNKIFKPHELKIRKKREKQAERRLQKKNTLMTLSDKQKTVKKGLFHVFHQVLLRGFDRSDPLHDLTNEVKNTINDEKLAGSVAKILVPMNNRHNPWLSGSFGHQRAEVLHILEQFTGPHDERFIDIIPRLCFDWGWPADADPEEVWDSFMALDLFRKTGQFTKLRRFLAFVFDFPTLDTNWTADQWTSRLFFRMIGEWLEAEEALPSEAPEIAEDTNLYWDALREYDRQVSELQAPIGVNVRGREADPAEAGRVCLRELRKLTKNGYALAAKILEDDDLHIEGRLMEAIFSKAKDHYLFLLDETASIEGTVRVKVSRALKGFTDLCREVWEALSDPTVLGRCCIMQTEDHPMLVTGKENHYASVLVGLALSFIKNIAWNGEYLAICSHNKYCGLLDDDADARKEHMADLRDDAEAIWYAERIAADSSHPKHNRLLMHMKRIHFNRLILTKEFNSILAALGWDCSNPILQELLDDIYELATDMFDTKKCCEDFFSRCQHVSTLQSKCGYQSLKRAYFEIRHSRDIQTDEQREELENDPNTLERECKSGRKYLRLTEEHYNAGRVAQADQVTNKIYDCASHKVDPRLKPNMIFERAPTLKKTGPLSDKQELMSMSYIKDDWRNGFGNLGSEWKAVLLNGNKKHVFWHLKSDTLWFACGAISGGALMWGGGKLETIGESLYCLFPSLSLTTRVFQIYQLNGLIADRDKTDEFHGIPIDIDAPVDADDGQISFHSKLKVAEIRQLTLVQFAFKYHVPLNGQALTSLCSAFKLKVNKLKGQKSVTNKARIVCLVKYLFPTLTADEQINMVIRYIDATVKRPQERRQDEGDMLLDAIRCLDADARKEFEKLEEKVENDRIDALVGEKLKKHKWFAQRRNPERWTCQALKDLAPKGLPGARIVRQPSTRRFQAYHPLAVAPHSGSTSDPWDNYVKPESDALINMINWIWDRHLDAGLDATLRPSTDDCLQALRKQYEEDELLEEQDAELKAAFRDINENDSAEGSNEEDVWEESEEETEKPSKKKKTTHAEGSAVAAKKLFGDTFVADLSAEPKTAAAKPMEPAKEDAITTKPVKETTTTEPVKETTEVDTGPPMPKAASLSEAIANVAGTLTTGKVHKKPAGKK